MNLKDYLREMIIREDYVKGNIKTFLKNMQKDKLDDEINEIAGNLDCIASLMLEKKFHKSKCDQIEIGNYLKKLGEDLIKYANEHIEQLEDDGEDKVSSKIKKEVRKEIDDFLDEIFGGK